MNDSKLRDLYIVVILGISILLVVGSLLIFRVSDKLSKEASVSFSSGNDEVISSNYSPIVLDDELKERLSLLIPFNNECNSYDYRMFNMSSYIGDGSSFCDNYVVYLDDFRWDYDSSFVYLYVYALVGNGESFGPAYNNLYVDSSKIIFDDNGNVSRDSIIGYGGRYLLTFSLLGNDFIYSSTSYVK